MRAGVLRELKIISACLERAPGCGVSTTDTDTQGSSGWGMGVFIGVGPPGCAGIWEVLMSARMSSCLVITV